MAVCSGKRITVYIIAILVGAFLLFKSNLLASFGGGSMSTYNSAPPQAVASQASPFQASTFQAAGQGVNAGLGVATQALQNAGSSFAKAIPIIGIAAGVILDQLMAASAKRRQQAQSENQAVGAAIPGWDQAITQIVNGYNGGSLSAAQAKNYIDVIWQNYWSEVGPVIQPGRNGCQSGQVQQPQGVSFCGGSYGAACCVGYDDLLNSGNNVKYALEQTDQNGKPMPASILPIFASKYGGVNRQGYTVTVARPAPTFAI